MARVSLVQLFAGLQLANAKLVERQQAAAALVAEGMPQDEAEAEAQRRQEQAVIDATRQAEGAAGGGAAAPGARIGILERCADWPCDARLIPTDALALAHPFDRDRLITFNEGAHVYHVRGERVRISVTGVAHAPFPAFDAADKIRRMRRQTRQEKYAGLSDQEIAQAWERNRDGASTLGTKMHAAVEIYLNTGYRSRDPAIQIEMDKMERFVAEEIVNRGLEVWRTEPIVFTDEPLLAGSVDCLLRRKSDGRFVVMDWKRSKEIKVTANGSFGYGFSFKPRAAGGDPKVQHAELAGGAMVGPDPCFEMVENTNYHHYSLQLHLYRLIFMRHYNLDIPEEELYIVVFHPDQTCAYEIKRAAPYAAKARWLIDNYATVERLVAHHHEVEERGRRLALGLPPDDGTGGH